MKKLDLRKVDRRVIELLRQEDEMLQNWATNVVGLFGVFLLLTAAIIALVMSALSVA